MQHGRRGAARRIQVKLEGNASSRAEKKMLKRRKGGVGGVCVCERVGEEVGSDPVLLPWWPHPDAAAAAGASRRSESVCSLERRKKEESRAEEPPAQTLLPHLKPVAAPSALWVREQSHVEGEICLHLKGEEDGRGRKEERRGIPGRRGEKERWEGAVAIRKSLQENHGSSNHGTAIYNAYQVTLYFS